MRTRQSETARFKAFLGREDRAMPAGLCDMLDFVGYLADQWTLPGERSVSCFVTTVPHRDPDGAYARQPAIAAVAVGGPLPEAAITAFGKWLAGVDGGATHS
jgi:hypothetical protein